MKKVLFIFLSIVMMLVITITFSTLKVNAEEGEEEVPNEETTTETNENEVTEDYAELRQSIAEILDSIDELKEGNVNWFEDELINHLISLVVCVVGTLVVISIYLKKTKLVGLDIMKLVTKGQKTDEDLIEDIKANVEFVKQQAIELGIKEEQINKVETSVQNLINNFNDKVALLEEQLKEQKVQNNEILEIIKIAFLNNPELVRTGYASKIEGIINKYEQRN